MLEFLAPWGILAPAITALITYIVVSQLRWREEREKLDSKSSDDFKNAVSRPLSTQWTTPTFDT